MQFSRIGSFISSNAVFNTIKDQTVKNIRVVNSSVRNTSTQQYVIVAVVLGVVALAIFKIIQNLSRKKSPKTPTPLPTITPAPKTHIPISPNDTINTTTQPDKTPPPVTPYKIQKKSKNYY